MRFGSTLALVALVALLATSFVGAEEATKKDAETKKADTKAKRAEALAKILKETKCPMSGRAVNPEKTVAYKDSKVYMCCDNCVKGFAGKVKKDTVLVSKANHQLVLTKQARQAKCAVNGKGKINKEAKTKVVGVQVNTCCKNCLGKLTKMEEKEQVELVFGKNFETSFVVKAQARKAKKAAAKKEAAKKAA